MPEGWRNPPAVVEPGDHYGHTEEELHRLLEVFMDGHRMAEELNAMGVHAQRDPIESGFKAVFRYGFSFQLDSSNPRVDITAKTSMLVRFEGNVPVPRGATLRGGTLGVSTVPGLVKGIIERALKRAGITGRAVVTASQEHRSEPSPALPPQKALGSSCSPAPAPELTSGPDGARDPDQNVWDSLDLPR